MALSVRTVLERNLLFRGLPPATLEQIARLCVRRTYERNAVIFSQSDPGDAFYGVVTGRVRISASSASGREVFLNIMEPGDTLERSPCSTAIRAPPARVRRPRPTYSSSRASNFSACWRASPGSPSICCGFCARACAG